jgi:hypothetical protein
MFELLTGLFSLIFLAGVYAIIRYGFNIVFVYILLFSAAVIIWGIAAIKEEKKGPNDEAKD